MTNKQKSGFAARKVAGGQPQIVGGSAGSVLGASVASAPVSPEAAVIPVMRSLEGVDQESASASSTPVCDDTVGEARDAWLNLASEDTLRELWDTPEEGAAWRDLLKEI